MFHDQEENRIVPLQFGFNYWLNPSLQHLGVNYVKKLVIDSPLPDPDSVSGHMVTYCWLVKKKKRLYSKMAMANNFKTAVTNQ